PYPGGGAVRGLCQHPAAGAVLLPVGGADPGRSRGRVRGEDDPGAGARGDPPGAGTSLLRGAGDPGAADPRRRRRLPAVGGRRVPPVTGSLTAGREPPGGEAGPGAAGRPDRTRAAGGTGGRQPGGCRTRSGLAAGRPAHGCGAGVPAADRLGGGPVAARAPGSARSPGRAAAARAVRPLRRARAAGSRRRLDAGHDAARPAPDEAISVRTRAAGQWLAGRVAAVHAASQVPVRGIYIPAAVTGETAWFNDLIDLVRRTELNAVVIDFKDDVGYLVADTSF